MSFAFIARRISTATLQAIPKRPVFIRASRRSPSQHFYRSSHSRYDPFKSPKNLPGLMQVMEKEEKIRAISELLRFEKDISGTLNKEHFKKSLPSAAAVVSDVQKLQAVKSALRRDVIPEPTRLGIKHAPSIFELEGQKKGIPLSPLINPDDISTLSPEGQELVKNGTIELIPYTLQFDYSSWNYDTIVGTILPDGMDGEIPGSFATIGHIAHLNLRDPFLPYKHIIAEVILDMCHNIKTVVNKTEDVGLHSEFRTFPMELIGGEDNYEVTQSSCFGCPLKFNFEKVYYNSRLDKEHERIVGLLSEGEVVCDVMAGVGPFTIPAAKKKKVMFWSNDLNPDSYASLKCNIELNRIVPGLVRPFNLDGREFIRRSAAAIQNEGKVKVTWPSHRRDKPELTKVIEYPDHFSHYLMNLPASAVEFLDAFQGLHKGEERRFQPYTDVPLPIIHVYTFKNEPEASKAAASICEDVSRYLGHPMKVERAYMKTPETRNSKKSSDVHKSLLEFVEDGVKVIFVRKVSPKKSMYCVSFRLPAAVAFKSELTPEEKDLRRRVKNWTACKED